MIDAEEMLYVVDENNTPLEPKSRTYVHKNILWHRSSAVWIINDKKQILCQKRSPKKDIKPGMWEAFLGGHLGPNEDYRQRAAKEVAEELGLTIHQNDLISYKILKSDKPLHREFQHIFALKLKENIDHFTYEKEEIDEIKWYNIKELRYILEETTDRTWVHKPWDKEILNWLETLYVTNS